MYIFIGDPGRCSTWEERVKLVNERVDTEMRFCELAVKLEKLNIEDDGPWPPMPDDE